MHSLQVLIIYIDPTTRPFHSSSRLIDKCKMDGQIEGFSVGEQGVHLTHLQYNV